MPPVPLVSSAALHTLSASSPSPAAWSSAATPHTLESFAAAPQTPFISAIDPLFIFSEPPPTPSSALTLPHTLFAFSATPHTLSVFSATPVALFASAITPLALAACAKTLPALATSSESPPILSASLPSLHTPTSSSQSPFPFRAPGCELTPPFPFVSSSFRPSPCVAPLPAPTWSSTVLAPIFVTLPVFADEQAPLTSTASSAQHLYRPWKFIETWTSAAGSMSICWWFLRIFPSSRRKSVSSCLGIHLGSSKCCCYPA